MVIAGTGRRQKYWECRGETPAYRLPYEVDDAARHARRRTSHCAPHGSGVIPTGPPGPESCSGSSDYRVRRLATTCSPSYA